MYLTLKILHILLEPTKKETSLDVDYKNLLSKIVKDYDVDVNSDFKHILSNMNDSGGFEGTKFGKWHSHSSKYDE